MEPQDAEQVAELLQDVVRLFKGHFVVQIEPLQIPPSMVLLLRHIGGEPGIGVGTVARRAGHSKGHVSVLVDQMVKRGLVEKKPHPTDQRLVNLHLTSEGEELNARLNQEYRALCTRLLQRISAAEGAAILSGLEHLRQALTTGQQSTDERP